MNKLFVFFLMTIMLVSMATALPIQNPKVVDDNSELGIKLSEGFATECSNFYDNSNYYTISKWYLNESTGVYGLNMQNSLYGYYKASMTGTTNIVDWTSNFRVRSAIVKTGTQRIEFAGGTQGSINSPDSISYVILCGYRGGGSSGDSSLNTLTDNGSGVPEFPLYTLGIAIFVVGLGLIFIRRN